MSEEVTVKKVEVRDGVYKDATGELMHIEIGRNDRDELAIRVTGVADDGLNEEFRVVAFSNREGFEQFVQLMLHSEYMGEL